MFPSGRDVQAAAGEEEGIHEKCEVREGEILEDMDI